MSIKVTGPGEFLGMISSGLPNLRNCLLSSDYCTQKLTARLFSHPMDHGSSICSCLFGVVTIALHQLYSPCVQWNTSHMIDTGKVIGLSICHAKICQTGNFNSLETLNHNVCVPNRSQDSSFRDEYINVHVSIRIFCSFHLKTLNSETQ